jgi:hypothetical protein
MLQVYLTLSETFAEQSAFTKEARQTNHGFNDHEQAD